MNSIEIARKMYFFLYSHMFVTFIYYFAVFNLIKSIYILIS